jgi:hypothetical protein
MTPLVIERPVKWPVNLFLGSGSDSGAAEANDGQPSFPRRRHSGPAGPALGPRTRRHSQGECRTPLRRRHGSRYCPARRCSRARAGANAGSLLEVAHFVCRKNGGRRDAPPAASALGHRGSDVTRSSGLNLRLGPPAIGVPKVPVRTNVSM